MNLVLTNICNRRCEYCFQKEWFLANAKEEITELSLENAEAIIKWYGKNDTFKILGGEPLLYSKLKSFLELVRNYNKKIVVISNISVETNYFEEILKEYNKNTIIGFLVNTDYPEHQKELFLKNLNILFSYQNLEITLSTTLLPNPKKIKEASDRLKTILKFCKTKRKHINIRVSPSEPNYSQDFYKYNFTLDIYDMYLRLKRVFSDISFIFDCPVNACEIDYQLYGEKGVDISFSTIKCYNEMPFDIMPNRSAIWCSSAKFLKINDVLKYKNIKECKEALREQYRSYWEKNKLLCNYKDCEKFGACGGLCISKNESFKEHL